MRIYTGEIGASSTRKSLVDVAKALNVEEKTCHRAIKDCRVVMSVYEALRRKMK